MHQLNGSWKAAAACCRARCAPSAPEGAGGAGWTFPWSGEQQRLVRLSCLIGAALTELLLFSLLGDPWSSLLEPRLPSQPWHFLNPFLGWKQCFLDLTTRSSQVVHVSFSAAHPSVLFSPNIKNQLLSQHLNDFLRLYEAMVEVLKGIYLLWAQHPH